jgi:hypothetical protein
MKTRPKTIRAMGNAFFMMSLLVIYGSVVVRTVYEQCARPTTSAVEAEGPVIEGPTTFRDARSTLWPFDPGHPPPSPHDRFRDRADTAMKVQDCCEIPGRETAWGA